MSVEIGSHTEVCTSQWVAFLVLKRISSTFTLKYNVAHFGTKNKQVLDWIASYGVGHYYLATISYANSCTCSLYNFDLDQVLCIDCFLISLDTWSTFIVLKNHHHNHHSCWNMKLPTFGRRKNWCWNWKLGRISPSQVLRVAKGWRQVWEGCQIYDASPHVSY